MDEAGIHFDPGAKVAQYSVAQRQLIEILKALSYHSSIVVFDEPTAALTTDETEVLFGIIRKLTARGISVIFISHRLTDIFAIGDRVLVLRDGEVTGNRPVEGLTSDDIIRMMVGRELSQQFGAKHNVPGKVVLSVTHLSTKVVKDVSFELHAGEILGVGGLIGAGRTELLRAIFGIDKYTGQIALNGTALQITTPRQAISCGFSMVPEDRKDQGLILMHSILQNIELNALKKVSKAGFIQGEKEQRLANDYIQKLEIHAAGCRTLAGALSGGNQQKVVLAKSFVSDPYIVLLDEPTRGVDVGAKAEIYRIIDSLACSGVAIMMVSSELTELLAVSDRIMVMKEGAVTGLLDATHATEEKIMQLAV